MKSLVIFALIGCAFSAPQFATHHLGLSAVHQPVLQTVVQQVPLTKTVHYEVKPQVVGYSQQILKPAIATHSFAAPLAVAAPVAVAQPAAVVETRSAVVAAPQPVAYYPGYATFSGVAAPAPLAVAAPAPILVKDEAALYEPLVTKEKVLAPVRSHQVITPQVTHVQPEVTVRKVITDVPVQQVVGVNQPIINQVQQLAPVHQVTQFAPAFQQHVQAFPGLQFAPAGQVIAAGEPQIISA